MATTSRCARLSERIRRIEGLERLIARYRSHIVCIDLLPVGAPRRNWKQTLLSDGHVILRHPDLEATLAKLDAVQKVADANPLKDKVDSTAGGLDLLSLA